MISSIKSGYPIEGLVQHDRPGLGNEPLARRDPSSGVRLLRQDNDLGADPDTAVEVDHVLVEHADASARDLGTDRFRCIGPVNAIDGIAEIHGTGAKRIARPAGHKAWQI